MKGWRRWRAALVLPCVVVALPGSVVFGWLWFEAAAVRDGLAELAAWRDSRIAEWNARDFSRTAIVGRDEPGNAWEAYERAIEDAATLLDDPQAVLSEGELSLRTRLRELPPSQLAALHQRWQVPLLAMREGTRRREVRAPIDWQRGHDTDLRFSAVLGLPDAVCLASLMQPSASLWSDGLVFAIDVMRLPWLISAVLGAGMIETILENAVTEDALTSLSQVELVALAEQLEALDPEQVVRLPHPTADVTLYAASVLGTEQTPPSPWSPALLQDQSDACRGLVILRDFAVEYERIHAAPFAERRQLEQSVMARIDGSGSKVAKIGAPRLTELEISVRTAYAKLRLLRMAVAWHLDRPIPELSDPLGEGQLGSESLEDGSVRFFSAGTFADPSLLPIERRAAPRR